MRILFRDLEKTEYLVIDQYYNTIGIFDTYQDAVIFALYYNIKAA